MLGFGKSKSIVVKSVTDLLEDHGVPPLVIQQYDARYLYNIDRSWTGIAKGGYSGSKYIPPDPESVKMSQDIANSHHASSMSFAYNHGFTPAIANAYDPSFKPKDAIDLFIVDILPEQANKYKGNNREGVLKQIALEKRTELLGKIPQEYHSLVEEYAKYR